MFSEQKLKSSLFFQLMEIISFKNAQKTAGIFPPYLCNAQKNELLLVKVKVDYSFIDRSYE